jgi:hypothetical protein
MESIEKEIIFSTDWKTFREMNDFQLSKIICETNSSSSTTAVTTITSKSIGKSNISNSVHLKHLKDSIFELLSMFPFQTITANDLLLKELTSFILRIEKLVNFFVSSILLFHY